MKRFFAGVIAVCGVLTAAACGSDHPSSLAPSAVIAATASRAAGAPGSTPSLIGTWSSTRVASAAATISLAVCSNIQMNITSQTATQASGILTMDCPDNATVSGALVGQLGGSTIPLTWTGTVSQSGFGSCPFSLTGTGTPIGGDMFHLSYSGNTCLGPIQGADTLRFTTPGTEPPGPAPPPPDAPRDGIDMTRAIIRNSPMNLGSWPVTTAIRVIEMRPNGVHAEFSKQNGPDRWPDVVPPGWNGGLQWTLGMALNIGGQWYASAPVQFWHGLDEAGGPPQNYAINWFYDPARWAPMTGHQPAVGETIGLFACAGDCRNNPTGSLSPVKERSNVAMVTMPGPGGARFTF